MFSCKKMLIVLLMTAVIVAPSVAQDTILFNGVKHKPLGNAKLVDNGDSIRVENIGSSGEDGVRLLAGEVQAITTTTGDMDPAQLPDGAGLVATTFGQVNGVKNVAISQLSMTDLGPDIFLHCKWLATAKAQVSARAEITLGGKVVAEIPNLQGPIARICDPLRCDIIDPIWPRWPRNPDDIWMMVSLGEPVPAFLPATGETVMADGFSVQVMNSGARIDNVCDVAYTATDLPFLDILRQDVAMNNLNHTGVGSAVLNGGSGNISVSNFGSEGDSGISVNLDDSTYYYMDIAPLCLDSDGASLTFEATGTMGSQSDVFLGTATMFNKGGELNISADYSAIGSHEVQVLLLANGRLTGSLIVPGGDVVARIPNPTRIGGCGKWDPFPQLPCYIIDLDDITDVVVAGDVYKADSLRVITTEAGAQLDSLNSFTVRGANIDNLMILSETTQSPNQMPNFKK